MQNGNQNFVLTNTFSSQASLDGYETISAVGPAKLLGFIAENISSSDVYLHIFDTNIAPVLGGTPLARFKVKALQNNSANLSQFGGLYVSTGLTIAASSTQTTYTAVSGALDVLAFWTR